MNIGFWSCIILVIPFLIIGVLFAIFKEKARPFQVLCKLKKLI